MEGGKTGRREEGEAREGRKKVKVKVRDGKKLKERRR